MAHTVTIEVHVYMDFFGGVGFVEFYSETNKLASNISNRN